MSKVAILGDTHFGARNDSELFQEFFAKFYEDFFFPYIEKNEIKHVIQTGDFMDKRKGVNFRTLNWVTNNLLGRLGAMNCEFHAFPGNHDIFYRHSNEINSLEELFSWMEHVRIYNAPTTITIDGATFDMIPWMNKYNTESTTDFISGSISDVCVGHFEIDGFEMHAGIPGHGGLDMKMFDHYGMVLSGHYHHRSTRGNITYVGTPYEITWSDFDDPRGFHVYDTEDHTLTFIENPFRMFRKAFFASKTDYSDYDFDQFAKSIVKVIVADNEDNSKWEWFISEVAKRQPADYTVVESDITMIEGIDEEALEALDTFTVLLHTAEHSAEPNGLDKDKLKKMIEELYSEAITLARDT